MRFRTACDWDDKTGEMTLAEIVAIAETGGDIMPDEKALIARLLTADVGDVVESLEPFNGKETFTRIA